MLPKRNSFQLTNRRQQTQSGTPVVELRWRQILVSVNRHGPGAKARHVQTAPTEAKFREGNGQKSARSRGGRCVLYHRRKEQALSRVDMPSLSSACSAPAPGTLQSGVWLVVEVGKRKLCHGPDLLNKGSLSRW
jgi:hypothetical protein